MAATEANRHKVAASISVSPCRRESNRYFLCRKYAEKRGGYKTSGRDYLHNGIGQLAGIEAGPVSRQRKNKRPEADNIRPYGAALENRLGLFHRDKFLLQRWRRWRAVMGEGERVAPNAFDAAFPAAPKPVKSR